MLENNAMESQRPDLSQVTSVIREYIEKLENEIARLRAASLPSRVRPASREETAEMAESAPPEPPTTIQVITLTASGLAKRTPRHQYLRQRRSGMGIFDLDAPEDDPPAILILADLNQYLLLFTSQARAFRLPVSQIDETPVRGRGASVVARMNLQPDERLVAALPDEARGAVALVSAHGMMRHLRHHIFGEYMKPGTVLFDAGKHGALAAVCRTPGDGDLFIATRQGKAIRFSEKLVPPQGGAGIRLEKGDVVTAVAAANDDSHVFLVDAIGRGTLRLMSGFAANKSAGGSGKTAMNTDCLVAALGAEGPGDIFMISRWSKIIRFSLEEVPVKEGVVQGVNCMALRADEVVAVAIG
jgi:DNA gyrase subunit A